MKKVAVILPTYNEKDNIEGFISEVLNQEKFLPGHSLEILVVDSHSPDGTGEIVKKIAESNKKVHLLEVGRGLGVALVEGHRYAIKNFKPDILAQLDADGQVGVDVLQRLIKAIDEGFDLALGSRFVKGGKNDLSFSRKLFTKGSSLVNRLLIGPWDIKEVTNSARAFTPSLFEKINFERLPWQEQSFIIQPAFLHEAILAGAKYKEVPLIFKNRSDGYSKNKVLKYTYDVITYAIDARLIAWGLPIPFYQLTRKAKVVIKFGAVGLIGTLIDFTIYNLLISKLGFKPATAKGFSTEAAIINNFLLNNRWTFGGRVTSSSIYKKFGIFNLVSLGGLAIAVLIIKLLHTLYGDGRVYFGPFSLAYYNVYFLVTIPPVLIWNFTVNNFITWRKTS